MVDGITMSYSASLKAHLARYKRSILGVSVDGTWSRNGRRYPHILPLAQQDLNLVEPIRAQCLAYIATEGIKRHRDFAHLNSSQAFAFNLLFPWLADGPEGSDALVAALGMAGHVARWKFEEVRDPREGTNFDLWFELEGGSQVFVEVKLTESGFGIAKANERRRRKLEEIYRRRLEGKVPPSVLNGKAFFEHYQLLRNLSYVDPENGHMLILLFPEANESAQRDAYAFLDESVSARCRSSVRIVHAEDLLLRLQGDPRGSRTAHASLELVEEKYALQATGSGRVSSVGAASPPVVPHLKRRGRG